MSELKISTYLAVQIKYIESEEMDSNLDIFHLDILSFPFAELLEWHEFVLFHVKSYSFRIKYESLGRVFHALKQI